jgi:hypothetical protein
VPPGDLSPLRQPQGATMSKPLIYRTLEGVEVPYGPVSRKALGQINIDFPTNAQPPTYEVVTVTDEVVLFPHDEESIKSESATPKEKAAWVAYLAEKAEQVERNNEETIRACFVLGIKHDLLPLPEDDSWLEPYRYLGMTIPENPFDLKLFWLFQEVVKTQHDVYALTKEILGAAGAYLGMRAAVANTFRGEVGKRNGADAREPDESATTEQQRVVA